VLVIVKVVMASKRVITVEYFTAHSCPLVM